MNNMMKKLVVTGLLALAAGSALAEVTVNYVEPDRFSDLPFGRADRDEVLQDLRAHFIKLGAKLPPGQDLRIDVKDIDLAGRELPGRTGRDLRIVKDGVDWPRMDLHYTLESGGTVLRSGDAKLRDMAFMQHQTGRYENMSLRYEKRMIDDWFDEVILARAPGTRR